MTSTVIAPPDALADGSPPPTGDRRTPRAAHPALKGALAGVVATAVGLGAGELVAGVMDRPSPITAVAGAVIDNVPRAIERWAISTFGRNDKTVLGIGIVVVLALAGALVGARAGNRRRPVVVGALTIGALGVLATLADRVGGPGDAMPVVAATVAGLGTLLVLLGVRDRPVGTATEGAPLVGRRRFLAYTGLSAAGAVALTAGGRRVGSDKGATASRAALASGLPPPVRPLGAPPAGVDLAIDGLTPWTVPNADFYRIDTAFVVPKIDARSWKMEIGGMVDRPRSFTYDDLLKRDLVEADVTLMCVSNDVGGSLVGNARWLGVPLIELLEEAGVQEQAEQVFSTSADGWTAGFPKQVAMDGRNALVAVGMNGEPLPFAHGFPARLVIPGIYGYVSATKWLTRIELLRWDDQDGYWIPRGWSRLAPVKTSSRIDVPGRGDRIDPGRTVLAGVAWAQHRGIAKVEVQVGADEPWQEATLAADGGVDSWRQWKLEWNATRGDYTIAVRATDNDGATQSGDYVPPAPDGAEGFHTIEVRVN